MLHGSTSDKDFACTFFISISFLHDTNQILLAAEFIWFPFLCLYEKEYFYSVVLPAQR